jgi:hypothetical protein
VLCRSRSIICSLEHRFSSSEQRPNFATVAIRPI